MSICYVKVCGGLGNQLFQVAAGYAYSKKYNKELIIDDSGWVASQGKSPKEYKYTIFKNFHYGTTFNRDVIPIYEVDCNYQELSNYNGNVSLNGYFQSLKYFENYKHQFIDQLVLPNVNCSIIKDESVAFHIRRGDYLIYPDIHLVCDTNYFHSMFEKFQDYNINVFTDSPQHVLNEFEKYNFNLIQTSSEINDLTLMSQHANVVCSNSSFSWWASILGKSKSMVIVPDKWYNDRPCEDIYCDFMTRL